MKYLIAILLFSGVAYSQCNKHSWRDYYSSRKSMMNCNLRGADLRGANLKKVNLRGANLRGANLKNADLTDANLKNADLTDANLEGALLEGADFTLAKLPDGWSFRWEDGALIKLPDGSEYVGEYKDGNRHGRGTLTYADGTSYVGEWKDNKYHGQGIKTYALGSEYKGEWKDGKYHGQGTKTWFNKDKYVGGFKEGSYHGRGTLTYADGRKYVGQWRNDKFTGFDYQAPNSVVTKPRHSTATAKPTRVVATATPKPTPIVATAKSSGSSISGFMAVLELEGNGISSTEAKALSNRLRFELLAIGELTIIERGKMDEVLNEQAFQQTGCVSSECAVEVGKLLGVENIITGSVSKVGTIYSVETRAVSVASGEIIKAAIYDYSGDIGGLLTQGMRKVAEELGK